LTNEESESKQKRLLYIIIGIISVVSLIIIFIIVINVQYRKKESSIDSKLTIEKSLSRLKNESEDIQSNDSFESHLSAESTAQKSEESHR
jgi:flagellar basal body-associated protein FliL